MGRRFKALIGVGAVTLALVSASLAWAAVTGPPTKVLGGRGSQMLPAATPGGSFLSWTLIRSGQVDAFLRPPGQPKIQLNRRGLGWNGNISGTEAITSRSSATGRISTSTTPAPRPGMRRRA